MNAVASTHTCTSDTTTASSHAEASEERRRIEKRVVRDVVPTFSFSTTIDAASPQDTDAATVGQIYAAQVAKLPQ